MEEKKTVLITVMGHKAKIANIGYELVVDPPAWQKEDITVWIDFEESVDGLCGFEISLPVESYTKEEFLAVVRHQAEKRVEAHLDKAATERRKDEDKRVKEEHLQRRVDRIKDLIGM